MKKRGKEVGISVMSIIAVSILSATSGIALKAANKFKMITKKKGLFEAVMFIVN